MSLTFLTGNPLEWIPDSAIGAFGLSRCGVIPACAGMRFDYWIPRSSRGMTEGRAMTLGRDITDVTTSFRRKLIRRTAESNLTKPARNAHNINGMADAMIPVVLRDSRFRDGPTHRKNRGNP